MNSYGIKRTGMGILIVSVLGFFFGAHIPIPLMGKFFLGAFGFGTGAVLIIVANIIRIKESESQREIMEQNEYRDEFQNGPSESELPDDDFSDNE